MDIKLDGLDIWGEWNEFRGLLLNKMAVLNDYLWMLWNSEGELNE